jgi:hypothetical protein
LNGKINEDWARDTPSKKISTPYNFKEKLSWLKNNILGPSRKFKKLTDFIPQNIELNEITTEIKLGFIGDIMKMGKKSLEFDPELKNFIADVDYLVGNFEGTISEGKKVFMAQEHNKGIIEDLKDLFPPEKMVLTNANNHSGDFGWTEFNKSYEMLKDNDFIVIGRKDEPSIVLDDIINLTTISKWSNQPCLYIPTFDDIIKSLRPDMKFNILYPHWGYEMQLYPNPDQIENAKNLLEHWDMIIGHHSHCPQPITEYETPDNNKLLAYSLGDFCINVKLNKYRHGIITKVDIGKDKKGNWKTGNVEWKFTYVNQLDKETTKIELREDCKFFTGKIPK